MEDSIFFSLMLKSKTGISSKGDKRNEMSKNDVFFNSFIQYLEVLLLKNLI